MSGLQDQHVPNKLDMIPVNLSKWFLLFWVIVGVGLDWPICALIQVPISCPMRCRFGG